MGNSIFNLLGGSKKLQNNPMNMMQAFQQFMMQNEGKNPNEVIQKMLSSGKLNQNQLNQAQQMAQQIKGPLSQFKKMFGF